MGGPLYISHSSLADFLDCPRLYYYKRIRKLELDEFHVPFFMGNVAHEGLNHLLANDAGYIEKTTTYFKKAVKDVRKKYLISADDEEDVQQTGAIVAGMLKAYADRYKQRLKAMRQIENEESLIYEFNELVRIVVKMDNTLLESKKPFLHEFKFSKYITPDYVKSIQTNIQTAIYYYIHNLVKPKAERFVGIIYDIARKPSIRQKKSESQMEFMRRLEGWYDKPGDSPAFHSERSKTPLIKQADLFNTINRVTDVMLRCHDKSDYFQNFKTCHGYYGQRCSYYELCHGDGETKENLLKFKTRQPYRVEGSKK